MNTDNYIIKSDLKPFYKKDDHVYCQIKPFIVPISMIGAMAKGENTLMFISVTGDELGIIHDPSWHEFKTECSELMIALAKKIDRYNEVNKTN